jgi:hypothetical protein
LGLHYWAVPDSSVRGFRVPGVLCSLGLSELRRRSALEEMIQQNATQKIIQTRNPEVPNSKVKSSCFMCASALKEKNYK